MGGMFGDDEYGGECCGGGTYTATRTVKRKKEKLYRQEGTVI